MEEKKVLDFSSVFDKAESVSMPDNQYLQTEFNGEISSWKREFTTILERADSVVNLISLIVVCSYLVLLGAGFVVEVLKGDPDTIHHLQAGFFPIMWGVTGWLFGKKTKRKT